MKQWYNFTKDFYIIRYVSIRLVSTSDWYKRMLKKFDESSRFSIIMDCAVSKKSPYAEAILDGSNLKNNERKQYIKLLRKTYGDKWRTKDILLINIYLEKEINVPDYYLLLPRYAFCGAEKYQFNKEEYEEQCSKINGIFLGLLGNVYNLDEAIWKKYNSKEVYNLEFDNKITYSKFLNRLRTVVIKYHDKQFDKQCIELLNEAEILLHEVLRSNVFFDFIYSFYNNLFKDLIKEKYIIRCQFCSELTTFNISKKYCSVSCRQKAYYKKHPVLVKKSRKRMQELRELYKKHNINKRFS